MDNSNFYSPTAFVFGKDCEHGTGTLVRKYGGTKLPLHEDGGSAKRSGLLNRVTVSLDTVAGLSA